LFGGNRAAARPVMIVEQRRSGECGVAALATLAKHYSWPVGYGEIAAIVDAGPDGTNLLALSRAAQTLGFATQGVKGAYDAIADVSLPAIAHLRTRNGEGHFVVLHRWNHRSVIVADPARGIRRIGRRRFSARWTGYLLTVSS
jgi:ABC-type bacteriocin/lantibiotic exporter with double-glycine peptidase domain